MEQSPFDSVNQYSRSQWSSDYDAQRQQDQSQDDCTFAVPGQPMSRQYSGLPWMSGGSTSQGIPYQEVDGTFDLGPDVDPRTIANVPIDHLTKARDAQPWNAASFGQQPQPWMPYDPQSSNESRLYSYGADDQTSFRQDSGVHMDPGHESQQQQDKVNTFGSAPAGRRRSVAGKSRTSRASSAYDASENASQTHVVSRRKSSGPVLPCSTCGRALNSRSDATKHAKTHQRPYKCQITTCRYNIQGFGTPNDCARHEATKHNLHEPGAVIVGFVCSLCQVPVNSKEKWWPRQDNFKAHLKRKHEGVDYSKIIDESTRHIRPDDTETVMSGAQSNFPAQSHADSDRHYQTEFASMLFQHVPGQITLSGEASWLDFSNPRVGLEELAGVGQSADLALVSNRQYDPGTYSANRGNNGTTQAILREHDGALGGGGALCTYATDGRTYTMPEQYSERKRIRGDDRNDSSSEGSEERPLKCGHCGKEGGSVRRKCDMRKHEARHNRPYGCTEPQCYDKHGSKSDWIRHEYRKHRLPESWLCRLRNDSGGYCNYYCRAEHFFLDHLGEAHPEIDEDDRFQTTLEMHLPTEGRTRFWCGFCNDVCPNESLDKPWEFRVKHVGEHMDLSGQRNIDQWICVELHKEKGSITAKEKKEVRDPPFVPKPYPPQQSLSDEQIAALLAPRAKKAT